MEDQEVYLKVEENQSPIAVNPLAGLTVGRNVHYVESRDTHFVALVVGHVNKETGMCDLAIFNNDKKCIDWRSAVPFAPADKNEKRTWHWIEPA